ncbi:MAG: hypothetical protein HQ483_10925 [Rhodospirillales bacterium]|nr:hypothetical protein [Rhodospirillales bacterium]
MFHYDFPTWLHDQLGLDLEQIKANGSQARADAELRRKGMRPSVEGVAPEKIADFADRVHQFMLLLGWGQKHKDVSDADWQSFRPIVEGLVSKNQMDRQVLSQFRASERMAS